jgi:hypothetical protein
MMIKLTLTPAEAKALLSCADEGFQGLANDKAAAKAYLNGQRGVNAAYRAIKMLQAALA